jgi:hypothetical protein
MPMLARAAGARHTPVTFFTFYHGRGSSTYHSARQEACDARGQALPLQPGECDICRLMGLLSILGMYS